MKHAEAYELALKATKLFKELDPEQVHGICQAYIELRNSIIDARQAVDDAMANIMPE